MSIINNSNGSININVNVNAGTIGAGVQPKHNVTTANSETRTRRHSRQLLEPEQAETTEQREARLRAAKELTPESTYEKLRAASLPTYRRYAEDGKLTDELKKIKAPKAEVLEKSNAKVLITGRSGEIELVVFDNGFFMAVETTDSDEYKTVGGVDRAFTNLGANKGTTEEQEKALNMPWTEILSIDAQIRFDHNQENREGDKVDLAIRGDGSDTAGGMKVEDHITQTIQADKDESWQKMKAGMKRKLPEAMAALKIHSEKQYIAVMRRQYKETPDPYKEIAADLDVTEARVNTLMNKGLEFLKKFMTGDAELAGLIADFED